MRTTVGWDAITVKLKIGILVVERADGVGLQKFSAKTFSGEHTELAKLAA